jgi:hypothetical protein
MEVPEAILGVMIGVGLAAACGFRVFVPIIVGAIIFVLAVLAAKRLFFRPRPSVAG